MKTITLRLDEELHKAFKVKMAQDGKTMQDRIIELIRQDLAKEEPVNSIDRDGIITSL